MLTNPAIYLAVTWITSVLFGYLVIKLSEYLDRVINKLDEDEAIRAKTYKKIFVNSQTIVHDTWSKNQALSLSHVL